MKKSFLLSLSLFFILSCHLAPYSPRPPVLPPSVLPPGGPNGDSSDVNLNNKGSQINAPNVADPARTRTNELPYNLIPDFLSALTCSNDTSFGSGYYTLSLSSRYEGLQLADSFKRVHQLNSSNRRSQISQNERSRILQALRNSPLRNTHAELSVRNRGNIYSSAQINGNPLIGYYFPSFNTDWVFNQLSLYIQVLSTRPINRSRYNSSPFRASLTRLKNRDFVQTIAPNLSQSAGDYMLALTYTVPQQNKDKNQLLADENQRPYGRSYTLNFNSRANTDYLTNVYEEDFLSSRRGGEWSCPSDLKFLIHKNSSERSSQYNRDAANRYSHLGLDELEPEGYCDLNDRSPLTKRQKDFLSLEFGENEGGWPFRAGISVVARDGEFVRLADTPCLVISRGSSCYQDGFYRVEFDPRWVDNCKRIHDFSSSDRDFHNIENAGVYRVCPAWLSMCYRNESN